MKFIHTVLRLLADVESIVAEEPAARHDQIAAMEKIADLALAPPKLNTSPLPEYDYDKLDYGMTIGIERTPGGRLWACGVAGGDSTKAFFVLATRCRVATIQLLLRRFPEVFQATDVKVVQLGTCA